MITETIPLPTVMIVIVCHDGWDDTLACLESVAVLTYPSVRTVVVDNASTDGTAGRVREWFPNVIVIEAGNNLGFAGGNNLGARYALDALRADYLFLLNNDTVVESGILEPLVAYAEASPVVGVVGPLMCRFDAPDTVWAAGGAMTWRAESARVGAGDLVLGFAHHAPREQDFIVGCGMLIPGGVWERLGGLDERYFLYYEDTDFCFRARRLGFKCVTVPSSRLLHKGSRSAGAGSLQTLYYMRRNALLFLEIHGSLIGRVTAFADDLRLFLVWILWGENKRVRVLCLAVGDYLWRRFGRWTDVLR